MTRAVPLFTDFLFQMHSIISMSFLDLPARKTACWDRPTGPPPDPFPGPVPFRLRSRLRAVHRISVGRHCIRQHPAAFRLQIIAPSVDPVPSGQHPAAGAEGVPAFLRSCASLYTYAPDRRRKYHGGNTSFRLPDPGTSQSPWPRRWKTGTRTCFPVPHPHKDCGYRPIHRHRYARRW